MTVSRIASTVSLAGGGMLDVLDGSNVAIDESWSPYGTANLTVAIPPADVLEQLDPRASPPPRLTVRIAQEFSTQFTVSDLTRLGWTEVSAWTAELAGRTLSWWSGRYSRPYNGFGLRQSRTRTFDLVVRTRRVDLVDGTLQLTLATDEALLQDAANTSPTVLAPPTNTVFGAVALALSAIDADAVIDLDDIDDVTLESGAVGWEPGVSAWDYVAPLVDAAGMRLWCDEQRNWHLTESGHLVDGYVVLTDQTATSVTDDASRDDDWHDAVVVAYRWRDASDVDRVRYSIAAPLGHSRVLSVTYDRPYPGGNAAAAILSRTAGRGRSLSLEAVLDPAASPGQPIRYTDTRGTPQTLTGFVTQVQWNLGDDLMQVRTRGIADTPATAWALAAGTWTEAAGVPWNAVTDERQQEEG